jgi:cation transport ATPase
MGSRERKREERRKRKRRAAERAVETVAEPANEPANGAGSAPESFEERMARRTEERNAAARAELKPLAEGERPAAVMAAAIVSTVLAVVLTVSTVLAAAGVEAAGQNPNALAIAVFAIAVWLMAWGMWRARYWAVLGFQMLLVLVLLASALGLVQVRTILEAIATLSLLIGAGLLFYFLIRAMARIQMPEPPAR